MTNVSIPVDIKEDLAKVKNFKKINYIHEIRKYFSHWLNQIPLFQNFFKKSILQMELLKEQYHTEKKTQK